MKYIALLLSFIIFSLSVQPCSDGQTCEEENNALTQQHEHSQDEEDHCTPFCICNCCGMSMTVSKLKFISTQNTIPTFSWNFYFAFDYSHLHLKNVWQPPRFNQLA